jgi:hypothetical protein
MKKSSKKKIEELDLSLNINRDDPNLNDFISCWKDFGARPNRITLYNTYSSKEFNDIILPLAIQKNVFTEVIPSDDDNIINDKMFVRISDGICISYVVLDRNYDNSKINEICFFYRDDSDAKRIQEIIKELNSCVIGYDSEEEIHFRLNTVSLSSNGLELEPIDVSEDYNELDLYYHSKTEKGIEKIIKKIKKSDSGLSVFLGERGTGKTSLIHYLAQKLDRLVIYIPNNMIDHTINNPEFRKFFKKHNRPVIIIDDCEMLTNEPFGRSSQFVGNLLQLVDGLFSETLQLQVITIFNVDKEDEVDELLLESNNLIDVVEFSLLTSEEANELSNHLGYKKKYTNKTRLLDVIRNTFSKKTETIGF